MFDEPSLCCFENFDRVPRLLAAGTAAQAMVGRTSGGLAVRRALSRGVLQDIDTATHLLRYAVNRAFGRKRMVGSGAVIGVPADATSAERGALSTAARDAGLGAVRLVSEPFAAAVGAGLPVFQASGTMIVECGAGTTEVAVLSLGGICLTRSVRVGGVALNQAIADHLRFRHKFLIGEHVADQIKQEYGKRRNTGLEAVAEIKGRSLVSMAPALFRIPLVEFDGVMEKHAGQIVDVVRTVLNMTPPELSEDIHAHGVVLTGGGAATPCLKDMIEAETGLPVIIAEYSERCVARGLQHVLLN